MQKAYNRTYWENKPSDKSPINQRNLNNIESGIDVIDDRVIMLDTTKFNTSDAQMLIKGFSLNEATGIITITYVNGSVQTIQTSLSKIPDTLDFDPIKQELLIIHVDGTTTPVNLSAVITQNEFADSDTVGFQLQEDGSVTAIVKEGSIEEKHLRPNYLADIKVESAKAESSRDAAAQSAESANSYADLSKSYAVGTGGQVRPNDADDNAKKYSEKAQSNANTAKEYLGKVEKAGEDAVQAVNNALGNIMPEFYYDFETGILYCNSTRFIFTIKRENGILYWGVGV